MIQSYGRSQDRPGDDDVVRCFIDATLKHSSFITQGGEGRGDKTKDREATRSEGRGLEERPVVEMSLVDGGALFY